MRFSYYALKTRRPVYPLGGITVRQVPIHSLRLLGPLGDLARDCRLDPGADDSIFPEWVAHRLGIDLSSAPVGEARPVGGAPIQYSFAPITFHLTDGLEICEWSAIVGFKDVPFMRWPLLGLTGFLQFFDVTFLGQNHEVIITPNSSFPGQHIVH